ncbi:hypothetical protein L7F22_021398 [Adiantum nelumboides]|nr:hypothetical protein [Adiantum nelumboides]
MVAILHPFYKTPELFGDIPLLTLRSEYLNLMLSEDDQLVIDGEMSSFMNNLGPTYLRSVATRSEATRFPLSWWQNYGRQGLPQLCKLALRVLSQLFGMMGDSEEGGEDVKITVNLTFREAVFGCSKKISFHASERCETCSMGKGFPLGVKPHVCKKCNGSGTTFTRAQPGFMFQSTCRSCDGAGQFVKERCENCKGKGSVKAKKTVNVDIPGIKVVNSLLYGDQIIHIRVTLPTTLSPRQVSLLEEYVKEEIKDTAEEPEVAAGAGL